MQPASTLIIPNPPNEHVKNLQPEKNRRVRKPLQYMHKAGVHRQFEHQCLCPVARW